MKKITKEALRYIILLAVSLFAVFTTQEIIEFSYKTPEMSTQIASLLGAVATSVLGVWGFIVKKFFETKVGE